jgi:hypothetical protein
MLSKLVWFSYASLDIPSSRYCKLLCVGENPVDMFPYYTSSPFALSSGVSNDGHGLVGFFEILDLLFREFDIDRICTRFRQMLQVGKGARHDPTDEVFQFIE